jgi:hypothetical protein
LEQIAPASAAAEAMAECHASGPTAMWGLPAKEFEESAQQLYHVAPGIDHQRYFYKQVNHAQAPIGKLSATASQEFHSKVMPARHFAIS